MKTRGFVNNLVALSKAVGLSYSTLKHFRRMDGFPEPRANGQWSVAATKRFIARHAQRAQIKDMSLGPVEQARLKLLCIKNESSEFRFSIEGGEQIPRDRVYSHVDTAGAKVRRELEKFFHHELPATVEGRSKEQIAQSIRSRVNGILEELPKLLPSLS
jgi:hypothetical protein